MADSPAITQLIATVQYSEKVPTAVRYANAEAGLFLQVDITGLSDQDADNAIKAAYERISSLVKLAIATEQTEAAAVAIVQQEIPGAQVQRPAAAPSGDLPVYEAKAENACVQCGSTTFGDARAAKKAGTVKPRYPDFKCLGTFEGKTCGKGVWLTKASA